MDRQHAQREIAAHERIAREHPERAEGHRLAARLLREQFDIPESPQESHGTREPIVHDITSRNKSAQRAEAERIRKWKESR